LPWIRTECVIDVIQGAAYLGQAVVFLYKAGGDDMGMLGMGELGAVYFSCSSKK
jgi:hypothetical protein